MIKKRKKLFHRKNNGYVMILVAAILPLVFFAIDYLVKQVQTTHKSNIKVSTSHAIGSAILETYNPAKPWDNQFSNIYSAAAQSLNDRSYELEKTIIFPSDNIDVQKTAKSAEDFNLVKMYIALSSYGINKSIFLEKNALINYSDLLCDKNPLGNVSFNADNNTISYETYSTTSGDYAYSAVSYSENPSILTLTFSEEKDYIECDCVKLDKQIKVYPPECNVDLVIAIPTNYATCTKENNNSADLIAPNGTYSNTPIIEIAESCQEFLQNNFSHTCGVAVGVIPYSAKISLPPNRSEWTVKIPPMKQSPNQAYFKQIAAYGTDGKSGGELTECDIWGVNDQRESYNWGNDVVGFPIMYRRGEEESWRGLTLYRGNLLSYESPISKDQSEINKFQQMNLNPCYVGHCNTLSMICEHDCPTYMANPYFISELTDDIQEIVHDLKLIRPINDKHNKSNFLFLPLSWACNLFSDWTFHPSSQATIGKKNHPTRTNKSKAVVIIVNAPDNFEPKELTYLGFNNDNSEIPMMESDVIVFKNEGYALKDGKYYGTKGIIEYSTSGDPKITDGGLDYSKDGNAQITVLKPGTVRIVTELTIKPTITFYETNGISQNLGTHEVGGEATFSFDGPQQIFNWVDGNKKFEYGNYTTKGPNFGHNLSINKLKCKLENTSIKEASLANQILRFYGSYNSGEMNGKSIIRNTNGHYPAWSVSNIDFSRLTDPCIYLGTTRKNTGTNWTWVSSSGTYYIQAYDFCPTCYGIGPNPIFIMATNNFPAYNVIDGDKNLAILKSSAWFDTNIDVSIYPDMYRVFSLDYPNSGSVLISTGGIKYKANEKYHGRYVFKRHYTRSPTEITLTSTVYAGSESQNYSETLNYSDQIKLTGTVKCTRSSGACGCDMESSLDSLITCYNNCVQKHCSSENCSNNSSFSRCIDNCQISSYINQTNKVCGSSYTITAGEWKTGTTQGQTVYGAGDIKDYFHVPITKNCSNVGTRLDGCTVGRKFTRTNNCYKNIDYLGQETGGGTCHSNDTLTEELSKDEYNYTNAYYNIKYKIDGTSSGPTSTELQYINSSHVEWLKNLTAEQRAGNSSWPANDPEITYVNHKYNLYNFFFINNNTVSYSSTASTNDILSNQYIGSTKENNDTWIKFCGDGQLTLKIASVQKNLKFTNIDDSTQTTNSSTSLNNITRPVLVTNNSSHIVTSRRVFYINTEQLTKKDKNDNYYFNLDIESGIRIVSVELINYPCETLTPSIEMYKEDSALGTEVQTVDIASKSDGSSTGKVTFRTNKDSAFTIQAMVPFAWIASNEMDFRQTSKTSYIYSNNNTHPFNIKISVPTPFNSNKTTISPTSFNNYGGTVTVSADRKLKSFTLSGKYDYVSTEIWTKQYISQENYRRTSSVDLKTNVSITGKGTKTTTLTGDNGQVTATLTYKCKNNAPEQCGSNGGCDNADSNNSVNYSYKITDKSGWSFSTSGRDWTKKDCGGCTGNGCSGNVSSRIGLIAAYTFTRAGNCTKTFNYNGEKDKDSCGPKDTLSTTSNTWSTHECTQTYTNERKTANECRGKSTYGSSYSHVPSRNQKNTNEWTSTASNILESVWSGSFGNYQHGFQSTPISEIANVKNIKISNQQELYTSGSYSVGGSTKASASSSGTNISVDLTATNSSTYNAEECYECIGTAVNCEIEMYSRIERTGKVGNTAVIAQMSTKTQSVEISPDQYTFVPDGLGYYTVTIDCENVVLSDPKMVDTAPFIRYAHPNLEMDGIKNTRIVDGNTPNPTVYGNMEHNFQTYIYQLIEHFKYWTINNSTEKYFISTESDIKKDYGDFFAIFWDYDHYVPSFSWELNQDTDFGSYTNEYSFSGIHRVFFPHEVFGNKKDNAAKFTSIGGGKIALIFAGFTMPLNYALYNNGYQETSGSLNSTLIDSPKSGLESVAKDACSKLTNLPGSKSTRIYIVKYRTSEATSLDNCGYQLHKASSKKELVKKLHEIAKDIKKFAAAKDGYVVQEENSQK